MDLTWVMAGFCFVSFLEDCEAANIVGAVELFVLKLRSRLKDSSVAEDKNPRDS